MKSFLRSMCWWLTKQSPAHTSEEIDRAIEELRETNRTMRSHIEEVKQTDLLRSLVISMNASKNQ